jgi:hypothetical protein
MLSTIINRRLLSSTMAIRPLMRAYTVIPSTPQQPTTVTDTNTSNDVYNPVHALYNNENQSVHESHSTVPAGQTYRSLSADDHSHHHNDTFGPTFNSVFDE